MDTEEALEYEYEEITDTGVVLRERPTGYSTHGYDFEDATGAIIGCALEVHRILAHDLSNRRGSVFDVHATRISGR
jgi:hypothetical protein